MNEEDFAAATRYRIVPRERLCFMPGIGIDIEAQQIPAACSVAAVRQELGVGENDTLFLCIAEFIPRKRHADLLRAFARLGINGAHLALAGSGPLQGKMEQLTGSSESPKE